MRKHTVPVPESVDSINFDLCKLAQWASLNQLTKQTLPTRMNLCIPEALLGSIKGAFPEQMNRENGPKMEKRAAKTITFDFITAGGRAKCSHSKTVALDLTNRNGNNKNGQYLRKWIINDCL